MTTESSPAAAGEARSLPRVGLVLGAGGIVGQAYHAGVLHTLEDHAGWDARTADVIVGSSAGAIVGTLLRAGIPAGDLAAWTVKAPLEDETVRELLPAELPDLARFRPRGLVRRPPRPPHPAMVVRVARRPWQFRPVAAFLSLATPGPFDITDHLDSLRAIEHDGWPARDLWICAVRRRDGRRVVFGRRGRLDVPLHLAVAASCAIPGYFAPVHIGSRAYIDGGVHSPTNADLLRTRTDLDLVIIVSPMSGGRARPTSVNGLLRRHSGRHLAHEIRALRAAGLPVMVFEPGPAEQAAMGDDLLSRQHVEEVVRTAYESARDHLARPGIGRLLSLAEPPDHPSTIAGG